MKQWTREEWAAHLNKWGMAQVAMRQHRGVNILVAEGQRKRGTPQEFADRMADAIDTTDIPNGYYRTVWALDRGGRVELGQALFFGLDHDPILDENTKAEARVNSALNVAIDFLEMQRKGLKYGSGGRRA